MDTTPPNMAVVSVPFTLVTNSQNGLLFSAETSLSTQSTKLPSKISFEEITASMLLKISPESKIPRKYSIEKQNSLFFFFITEEANNIEKKRKKQRGTKVKEQRNEKCKYPQ
jgi:hypothetical protein